MKDQPQEATLATNQTVVASAPSDERMAMAAEYAAHAADTVQASQSVGEARIFLLKTNAPQEECDALAAVQTRLLNRAEAWMQCRRIILECEGTA